MATEGAFICFARVVIDKARVVWTCLHTVSAPDTTISIYQNGSVSVFERSANRADIDARRLDAMVAEAWNNRQACVADL